MPPREKLVFSGSSRMRSQTRRMSFIGDAYANNTVVVHHRGWDPLMSLPKDGLTALTVNNVFGFNQVANGLNISAGGVDTVGDVALPVLARSLATSLGAKLTSVSNGVDTPKGWTDCTNVLLIDGGLVVDASVKNS